MRKRSMLGRVLLLALALLTAKPALAVINGHAVEGRDLPDVVRLSTPGRACTATVVGPRVVLTAAHCVTQLRGSVTFKGARYDVVFETSRLAAKGHDLAVAITRSDIIGARYATIDGSATVGESVLLLGYGCMRRDGLGRAAAPRYGQSTVFRKTPWKLATSATGGGALCYGDSGGPTLAGNPDERRLIGVNSSGNISDTNVSVRLDSKASRAFLSRVARQFRVGICGVTTRCPASETAIRRS